MSYEKGVELITAAALAEACIVPPSHPGGVETIDKNALGRFLNYSDRVLTKWERRIKRGSDADGGGGAGPSSVGSRDSV